MAATAQAHIDATLTGMEHEISKFAEWRWLWPFRKTWPSSSY